VLRVLFEDKVGGFKGVMVLKGTWDSFQGMQTFFFFKSLNVFCKGVWVSLKGSWIFCTAMWVSFKCMWDSFE